MLPNIPLERLDGSLENICDYIGKVLVIVNVASQCGFTSQYRELQSLYQEFHDKGFEILAFPAISLARRSQALLSKLKNFVLSTMV